MRSSIPLLSLVLFAGGCTVTVQNPPPRGNTTPAPAPARARPAPAPARAHAAPAPARARPAGRVVVLNLRPRDVRVQGSVVLYEPGRHVKRATYHTWRFPRAQFERVVGKARLAGPAKLRVRELRVTRRRHVPTGRGPISSPSGGFTYVTHHGRVLKALAVGARPVVKRPARSTVLSVTVDPKKVRLKRDFVVYSPHAGVKRAKYLRYLMTRASFRKVVGSLRLKRPTTLRLECGPETRAPSTRSPRRGARPEGGILRVHRICRVLGMGPRARRALSLPTRVITLVPKRLRIHRAKGYVTLEPNRRVRRASYTTWRFTWASFRRVVGKVVPRRPIRVKVAVTMKATRRRKVHALGVNPQGGFRYITMFAKILQRVP